MKLKNSVRLLVVCDSGAGAGKTTAAKYLSKKYGLTLLTSGLLYRYVAYKLISNKKKISDYYFLKKIIRNIRPKLLKNYKLYSNEVTNFTSEVAKVKKIRHMLRNYQKKFASKRLSVLEGRDMGILFPNADIKFFFKCSLKIAAKRRFKELNKKNKKIKLKDVKKSIKIRNFRDISRKHSPLLKSSGAVIVDTGKLRNISGMIKKMSKVIEDKIKTKYGNWSTGQKSIKLYERVSIFARARLQG